MIRILVLHGPNLNLLGKREAEHYGKKSLSDINGQICAFAEENKVVVDIFQSNSEGGLVDRIQEADDGNVDAIVLNAAAYTHTSVAIRDAILAVNIPTVEVHLTNTYRRESFRHVSRIADVAIGQVSGFGSQSYLLGILGAIRYLEGQAKVSKEEGVAVDR